MNYLMSVHKSIVIGFEYNGHTLMTQCILSTDNTMVQGWNNPYHNSFKAQLISFKILKINETNNTNILGELMYSNTNCLNIQ